MKRRIPCLLKKNVKHRLARKVTADCLSLLAGTNKVRGLQSTTHFSQPAKTHQSALVSPRGRDKRGDKGKLHALRGALSNKRKKSPALLAGL
jgi:hypothetical protein